MRRVSILIVVLLVGFAAGQEPPPFGTVIEQWNLQMSGSYAGSGISWVRDSGKFFLVDQGYSGPPGVWKLDPADPESTIEAVPWTFAELGDSTVDIPWSIAWDCDSGCFWVSHIVDGDIYAGCCLLRYTWNDSAWVWSGSPADSWLVGTGSNGGGLRCLWLAGFEKWPGLGQYLGVPVASAPSPHWVRRFDPHTKTHIGDLALSAFGRGLALVPWDSAYVLMASPFVTDSLYKFDTTGYLHQRAAGARLPICDWTVLVPRDPDPSDTVCVFAMCSNAANTFHRISVGMLWSQLGSVAVEERTGMKAEGGGMNQTICRGTLEYQPTARSSQLTAELLDITGRKVMSLRPGENDVRHLAPGVYFVRHASGVGRDASAVVRKVVIQR